MERYDRLKGRSVLVIEGGSMGDDIELSLQCDQGMRSSRLISLVHYEKLPDIASLKQADCVVVHPPQVHSGEMADCLVKGMVETKSKIHRLVIMAPIEFVDEETETEFVRLKEAGIPMVSREPKNRNARIAAELAKLFESCPPEN